MGGRKSWSGVRVYTLGHSTRALDELLALLQSFGIATLVDIRTVPRSRHNPQFNRDTLPAALRRRGVRYVHLPSLGGLRHARKDSINTGWQNASFRGFADYMQTASFEEGLAELRALAQGGPVALMCAEAVPWRCHRSLVADALTIRGAEVEHVTAPGRSTRHRVTSFAKVEGERVTYPGGELDERLPTRAPFHLEATARVLQRRPNSPVDLFEDGRYLRVLPAGDGLVLVEVEDRGTIERPDVRLSSRGGDRASPAGAALAPVVRRILGLDVDPGRIQRLAEAEPRLRRTAMALRGMRPPRFPTLFEAFANVVPFQQVSLEAGVAVTGRLVERFGSSVEIDGRRLRAFPTATDVAEARLPALRACGLSARKSESLRDIARAIASGELTEETIAAMSTADALGALMELPGVGPWSAGLVLLRGLGRLDVFPQADVGATRGLGALLGEGASLERVVERFGDLRGYLYFYSLGASLLARGLIHAARARRPERRARRRLLEGGRAERSPETCGAKASAQRASSSTLHRCHVSRGAP